MGNVHQVIWHPSIEELDLLEFEKCQSSEAIEDCGQLFCMIDKVLPHVGLDTVESRSLKDVKQGVFGMFIRKNAVLCVAQRDEVLIEGKIVTVVYILLLRPCSKSARDSAREMALDRVALFDINRESLVFLQE